MAAPNLSSPSEVWKDVESYESLYQVSNLGRVKSKSRGTFLKCYKDKSGYWRVSLTRRNKTTSKLLHRLIACHFIPNPEGKPQVNHIDGNKSNPSIENLEWVTPTENALHASAMGLLDGMAQKSRIRMVGVGAKYGSKNIKIAIDATRKHFAALDNDGNVVSEHKGIKTFCRERGFNSKHFFTCLKSGLPYRGVRYKYL
ncbi:hypothetical protein GGR92_005252 [Spirosoma lacussanchae]|uniref:NUMOD4 motif-containing HNH endonuclease n=1 Tax=Spirosoma lacussanchae TaxID=1884249 RepID=UPI00110A081E|nr:NUMOD4 motif-containing HNH endonuclease [Spirosoma lacussanchae]